MKQLNILIAISATVVIAFLIFSNKELRAMDTNMEAKTVKIQTSLGDITLKLYPDKAPVTVQNFIEYVDSGHYEDTIFHRVIDGFMIQGGGYTENLTQKPTRDPIINEANNGLKNRRGTIAMARTHIVDSATAQFFINVVDNSFLDFKGENSHEFGYCVFGEVTDGMDIVDRIRGAQTQSQGPYQDLPVKPIKIIKAKLITTL